MFVHVVLTEDFREDWTCPFEPPLKIKSLLSLLLLLMFRWRPMTSNLRKCLIFARKPVNINVLRSATPKLAHVPANRYYFDVYYSYLNVCSKLC